MGHSYHRLVKNFAISLKGGYPAYREHEALNSKPNKITTKTRARGNAFKIVLTSELIEKSGFTVEEVHEMTLEADGEKMVVFGRLRAKGNRWGVDAMIPGDIDNVAITRKGLEWAKHVSTNTRTG